MRNKISLLTTSLLAVLSVHSFAQTKSFSKLEIAKGDTYVVGSENVLFVDTLIMHDKSTIKFNSALYGVLEAKAAYIGDKCTITSKGEDGKDGFRYEHGTDGGNGGSLTLTLHFKELDELTIDTRGGNGGNGLNGKNGKPGPEGWVEEIKSVDAKGNVTTTTVFHPGMPGTPGGNATDGGNNGNGGNLMLVYSTAGFIPIFNNTKGRNNINILYTAGKRGATGKPGVGGHGSYDGVVVYNELRTGSDGKVDLININSEAAQ